MYYFLGGDYTVLLFHYYDSQKLVSSGKYCNKSRRSMYLKPQTVLFITDYTCFYSKGVRIVVKYHYHLSFFAPFILKYLLYVVTFSAAWLDAFKFRTDIQGSQSMSLTNFGNPLICSRAPPAGHSFLLSSEISQNIHDGLIQHCTDIYDYQMMYPLTSTLL